MTNPTGDRDTRANHKALVPFVLKQKNESSLGSKELLSCSPGQVDVLAGQVNVKGFLPNQQGASHNIL